MKPYLVSNITEIKELCSLNKPTPPTNGNNTTGKQQQQFNDYYLLLVIGLGVALGVALVLLLTTLGLLIIFCIYIRSKNEYQSIQDSASSDDKL